jgi:hypothetical protein
MGSAGRQTMGGGVCRTKVTDHCCVCVRVCESVSQSVSLSMCVFECVCVCMCDCGRACVYASPSILRTLWCQKLGRPGTGGVKLDDQLSFADNIAVTSLSCRQMRPKIKRIRPFLPPRRPRRFSPRLLLSNCNNCISLPAGLPACAIHPLDLIHNGPQPPHLPHCTPPPQPALATGGSGPSYTRAMVRPYTRACPLCAP